MKTQRIRSQTALLLACASLTGAFAATTYTLTDLGTGWANDINTSGKVVGTDSILGGWYLDGTNRTTLAFPAYQLGTGPGSGPEFAINNTLPAAISDNGRIVGRCVFSGPPPPQNLDGFFYDVGGTGALLGPVSNHDAFGVNSAGQIVGTYFLFDGTNITALNGGMATGNAINDAGLAVGHVVVAGTGWFTAVSFSGGTNSVLDLGPIGTSFGFRTESEALSVNASGQVVGYVKDAGSSPFEKASLPYLYGSGGATVLGSLGGRENVAKDINDAGLIVGSSMVADNTPHAFVYAGGVMSDLNPLISAGGAGWVVTSANAVNASGVIVGEGMKDGAQHAFLLTPASNQLPPVVNFPLAGTNLFAGESFTLVVVAAGSGPLIYQWQHAGTNVPAATNATYTVASASVDDAGSYLVRVTNAFGTATSTSATVQVKVLPDLQLGFYTGLTLSGPVGQAYRIEAVEQAGDTNWQTLANVTLGSHTYFWVDTDSSQHPGRTYRAVPLP